jgi:hypothetical protein
MELPGNRWQPGQFQDASSVLVSTSSKVIFVPETRNSNITKTTLINRFNVDDAHIVPAQVLSRALWLLWDLQVAVTVEFSSKNLILALCTYKHSNFNFGLICMYGDPHHQNTSTIWAPVHAFVLKYSNMPMLCTGDLNNIISVNEKLGPRPPNMSRISNFCCLVKNCDLFDLGYNGPTYTWTISVLPLSYL